MPFCILFYCYCYCCCISDAVHIVCAAKLKVQLSMRCSRRRFLYLCLVLYCFYCISVPIATSIFVLIESKIARLLFLLIRIRKRISRLQRRRVSLLLRDCCSIFLLQLRNQTVGIVAREFRAFFQCVSKARNSRRESFVDCCSGRDRRIRCDCSKGIRNNSTIGEHCRYRYSAVPIHTAIAL